MLKAILMIIALIAAMILGGWLFWHLMGLIYYVGYLVVGLVFFVGLCSIAWMIMKPKGIPISHQIVDKAMAKAPKKYKVYDTQRKGVYAFRIEPSLQDIAKLSDELHVAQLELQGDILELQNDTKIKIVQDEGKEAVKIKIVGAKTKEKELWVARSSVVKDDTQLKRLK
jgi:hypothetical protein